MYLIKTEGIFNIHNQHILIYNNFSKMIYIIPSVFNEHNLQYLKIRSVTSIFNISKCQIINNHCDNLYCHKHIYPRFISTEYKIQQKIRVLFNKYIKKVLQSNY